MFERPGKKRKSMDTGPPPPRIRSQAHRRCFEEKIDRILSAHFADFDGPAVETHTVDGATLRLAIARIVWPDETSVSKRLSSVQIMALRMAYASGDIAECLLVEPHGVDDSPSKRVVDACSLCVIKQTNKRDRRPLLALLPTLKSVSRGDAKEILRTCMTLRPSSHPDLTNFVISIMKTLVQFKVDVRFPRLVCCLTKVFDDALVAMHSQTMRAEGNLRLFREKCGHLFHLVTDATKDINALIDATDTDFRNYLDKLHVVVKSSSLGKAMFEWALPRAAACHMKWYIEEHCKYPADRLFTLGDLHNLREQCQQEAEKHKEYLSIKFREIVLQYRTFSVTLKISSAQEEIELRTAAWLKSTNVMGCLQQMKWEEMLFMGCDSEVPQTCANDVLDGFTRAREAVDMLLENTSCAGAATNIDDLKAHLTKNRAVWLSEDPTFVLEIGVLACLAGEAGEKMVEDRILASLPTAEVEKGASEMLAAVKEIMQSVWFPWIPQSAQASVKIISNIFLDMTQHKCPRGISFLKSTSFLRNVEAGLCFMVSEICADGTIAFGSTAVEAKLDKYLSRLRAEERVTYGDLTPLAIFEWLLPPTRLPDLERCRDGVIEAMEQECQVLAVRASTNDEIVHELNDLGPLAVVAKHDTAAIESEEEADTPSDIVLAPPSCRGVSRAVDEETPSASTDLPKMKKASKKEKHTPCASVETAGSAFPFPAKLAAAVPPAGSTPAKAKPKARATPAKEKAKRTTDAAAQDSLIITRGMKALFGAADAAKM